MAGEAATAEEQTPLAPNDGEVVPTAPPEDEDPESEGGEEKEKGCFKKVKNWFKPSHKCCKITNIKRIMLLRKSILFLLDLITDIIFTISLFQGASPRYGLGCVSILFLLMSLVIGNKMLSDGVSFQFTSEWLRNKTFLTVLEVLQLKPMMYPIGILTHSCRRMWIIERFLARYAYVRYIERMLENTPEMILQVYVMTKNIFEGENDAFTDLNFFKVSNLFSLVLSICMLPTAIIEYETTSRTKDIESNDFTVYKLCNIFPKLNANHLMACKLYKALAEFTLSRQTFVKHIIYMAILVSRLVFFSLFFLAVGSIKLNVKVGSYDLGAGILPACIVVMFMIRFIYYFCILRAPRKPPRCSLISLFHIFTATLLHFIVPNKDLNYRANKSEIKKVTIKNDDGEEEEEDRKIYEVTIKQLIDLVFVNHIISIIEWIVLALLLEFYFKEQMVASFPNLPGEYISVVTGSAIGLYILALVLYYIYWRFWHPDRIGGKVLWKRVQMRKFKAMAVPKLDKNDPEYEMKAFAQFKKEKADKDYELKKFGVGQFIDCDYKDKALSPEQRAIKKKIQKMQKKKDGPLGGLFKCMCYDPGFTLEVDGEEFLAGGNAADYVRMAVRGN